MHAPRTQGFDKMHGAGNDFVVLHESTLLLPESELAMALADRHRGVGFDQLMLVTENAEGFGYRVLNADGSHAQQCGNGARAVAHWLIRAGHTHPPFMLESPAGKVQVTRDDHGQLSVTLGKPVCASAMCLSYGDEQFTLYPLTLGNPHATLVVPDCAAADVDGIGTHLQKHAVFPERVNVGFCEILSRTHIRLRVFERGAGETLACGSGACAAAINVINLGLTERSVQVGMPGGSLRVHWPTAHSEVSLAGPVEFVFHGEFFIQKEI
jgi:diaminopimelate epimerase